MQAGIIYLPFQSIISAFSNKLSILYGSSKQVAAMKFEKHFLE